MNGLPLSKDRTVWKEKGLQWIKTHQVVKIYKLIIWKKAQLQKEQQSRKLIPNSIKIIYKIKRFKVLLKHFVAMFEGVKLKMVRLKWSQVFFSFKFFNLKFASVFSLLFYLILVGSIRLSSIWLCVTCNFSLKIG